MVRTTPCHVHRLGGLGSGQWTVLTAHLCSSVGPQLQSEGSGQPKPPDCPDSGQAAADRGSWGHCHVVFPQELLGLLLSGTAGFPQLKCPKKRSQEKPAPF